MRIAACLLLIVSVSIRAQDRPQYISQELAAQLAGPWSDPHEPFKILDNLYYVGGQNIASYLLTSPQGHILIDTGMPRMPKAIVANIQALGFKPTDIKIMLSSHAHVDHVGGHAEMQRITGAQVMALGADAQALREGRDLSPIEFDGWAPVKVDRVLRDGDVVTLGPWRLRAMHSPGHTPGATTWITSVVDGGRTYTVVLPGGTTPNPGPPVVGNPKHPQLADETLATLQKLRDLPADIELANHPQMLFAGKIEAIKSGARPHPLLVDRAGWTARYNRQIAGFEKRIETDRNARAH